MFHTCTETQSDFPMLRHMRQLWLQTTTSVKFNMDCEVEHDRHSAKGHVKRPPPQELAHTSSRTHSITRSHFTGGCSGRLGRSLRFVPPDLVPVLADLCVTIVTGMCGSGSRVCQSPEQLRLKALIKGP